ncbi:hypothetical protein VHEMI08118 [[Torrubiella] hemipterigena]|uniref:Uncharacterized protein n=1 Tax=[Torrubiella] hemipterigena TaxID=1531966 RepID=A0A0A1T5L7_9HYPO|nr:hypothetical protein VHEMI08118 [[Torrubiella] hemipterigena]
MSDTHSERRPSSVKSTTHSIRGFIHRLTNNPEKYTVHTEIPRAERHSHSTTPRAKQLSQAQVKTSVYETLCLTK